MPEEAKEQAHTTMATLAFTVRRRDPELVSPAAPTPLETKRLSDIDDQGTLRRQVPFALFYRGVPGLEEDVAPAGVIRRALSAALVQYYPLAGRLREVEGRKLVVDCTGEGVLFVEADADVRLMELERAGLRPPFPCMDKLLSDVEGSGGVLDCPLLLIQVTRLLCGGFVFTLRLNHTICDAVGITQFMNAVAELARGHPTPTVAPAWSRELLEVRCPNRELDDLPPPPPTLPPSPTATTDMVMRSFTFSPADIAAIKKHLPPLLRDTSTTFEALTAWLWRARTAALEVPPGEDSWLVIIANFRAIAGMDMPTGYYGNACVPTTVLADAVLLLRGSLGDALALVRRAKTAVTADYVRSTLDELVLGGRPELPLADFFMVSDNRHAGFHHVDLGWGEPVYGGPADTVFGVSFFVAVKDSDGEDAVAVPIMLPSLAMERFATSVEKLCKA